MVSRGDNHTEGRESRIFGPFLFYVYGKTPETFRRLIRRFLLRIEGGYLFSRTIRRIFLQYHGVDVGLYSGPGCFVVNHFRKGTTIGRYSVIYPTAEAFNANHPMNTRSTHSLFYNPCHGFVKKDLLHRVNQNIGNDVFIGHNAIIAPSVSAIGDGAIIGAGSVVNKDVPPYAVVVGNPARVIRYRFSDETIKELLESRWWNKTLENILPEIDEFQYPLEGGEIVR